MVSGNYFQVLQVQPALGRLFDSNDDRLVGEAPVVVLSHDYWTTQFAADPGVLNKTMIVNGQTLTIVGVAPRGFDGTTLGSKPQRVRADHAARHDEPGLATAGRTAQTYWAYLFARLRPGVPIETARAALNAQYHAIVNDVEAPLQKGMSDATMARFRAKPILVEPGGLGQSSTRGAAKTPLYLLLSVTGFVLLIACANIANLLLARSAARASEMAVRLSIGASRARLIGQLLTESLLLAVVRRARRAARRALDAALILSLMPAAGRRRRWRSRSARRALLFAGALTIGTGLLFGLFPALHSTRPDLVSTLKNQAGQPSGARGAARFRLVLATTQIALSMLLLAASGFFVKSLLNVSRVDLGIKVDNVITFGAVAGVERLHAGAHARVLPSGSKRSCARRPASPASPSRWCRCSPAATGATTSPCRASRPGPTPTTTRASTKSAPATSPRMGIPLMSGREFTDADAGRLRRRSRSSTRSS